MERVDAAAEKARRLAGSAMVAVQVAQRTCDKGSETRAAVLQSRVREAWMAVAAQAEQVQREAQAARRQALAEVSMWTPLMTEAEAEIVRAAQGGG